MSSPSITVDTVKRLTRLARLDVPDAELPKLAQDLGRILDHVASLDRVDTSSVEPTAHVSVVSLPLRADEPVPSLSPELALREAPRAVDGAFAVPAFVEE